MCLIFVGQGYPRKLFNLKHFPIYGIRLKLMHNIKHELFVHNSLADSRALGFYHVILN